MSDEHENIEQPEESDRSGLRDGGLKFVDKLRVWLETELNMTAIMAPNNALSRRSVRIAALGRKLSPLPFKIQQDYTPLELLQDVQITVRLSGGNAGDYLTSQMIQTGIALQCLFTDDLMVLEDVGQQIHLLDRDQPGRYLFTRIVGDAEMVSARRISSGIEVDAESDQHSNKPYIWSETWVVEMVMTVHRYFNNPKLKQVVYHRDPTGEEFIVDGHSQQRVSR
jgi:hypothetical protein